MMETYSINGWEQFQHYKDRNPPWVKLHGKTLTSPTWLKGTDRQRMVQVASIMLAARYDNAIPLDMEILRPAAGLKCTDEEFREALAYLEQSDFITISQRKQRASKPQAKRSPSRVEDIDQSEKETPVAPYRLPDDWKPEAKTVEVGKELGLTDEEISAELQPGGPFFDHFQGPECKQPKRPGWDRTARAWLRRGAAGVISRRVKAARAPASSPTSSPASISRTEWTAYYRGWKKAKFWPLSAGPNPDDGNCRCPQDVIDEVDLEIPEFMQRRKVG